MSSHAGAIQEPKTQSLARQGSLHNLTLDEVQSQLGDLGKPLGSISLDELLKNVWTVESSQAELDTGGGGGGGPGGDVAPQPQQQPAEVPLQRQTSINLPGEISKKTVGEVWKDIEQKKSNGEGSEGQNYRQATFGEMTLEDFLSQAGLEGDSIGLGQTDVGSFTGSNLSQASVLATNLSRAPRQSLPEQSQWIQYQAPPVPQQHQHLSNTVPVFMQGHPVQQAVPAGPSQIMDLAYPETQVTVSPPALVGTVSDTQSSGRKRVATSGAIDRNVEKKQKRMIKNRESAARSRARRQAYTQELENKVSRLEEENKRLKKERDLEKVLPSVPPPEPKYQLRRTSSCPF